MQKFSYFIQSRQLSYEKVKYQEVSSLISSKLKRQKEMPPMQKSRSFDLAKNIRLNWFDLCRFSKTPAQMVGKCGVLVNKNDMKSVPWPRQHRWNYEFKILWSCEFMIPWRCEALKSNEFKIFFEFSDILNFLKFWTFWIFEILENFQNLEPWKYPKGALKVSWRNTEEILGFAWFLAKWLKR